MAHHGSCIAAVVVAAVMGWTFSAAATESSAAVASQPSPMAPDAHVRGESTRLGTVITEAAAQSRTFRGLVDRIGTTDGIVYVAEGRCGHGVRACLLHAVTISGPSRVLRIVVDPRKSNRDLMGSIGHELQHAVEVLSNPTIRSNSQMILLYHRAGDHRTGRFETDAAIRAGDVVRGELMTGAVAERRE